MGNEMPAAMEINMKNMVNPLVKIASMSSKRLASLVSIKMKFITDKIVS